MRVRQGWSGQVSEHPDRWAKFDIELEEVDLVGLLGRHGISRDAVNTFAAFTLLELEAERLVYVKLVQRYGYPQDEGVAKIKQLSAGIDATIGSLKALEQAPA